ncbi:hypothetical protein BGZ94_007977 [Podila epigama]|nr:hypothetical protein BGZ94_007977 [Podila epigama]
MPMPSEIGGVAEGLFGSQVEQRVGHHINDEDELIHLGTHIYHRQSTEGGSGGSGGSGGGGGGETSKNSSSVFVPVIPGSRRVAATVAFLVSSKRRKSWFLGLIIVSLVFTALSGAYLLSQFHQRDFMPTTSPTAGGSDGIPSRQPNSPSLGSPELNGPRRNRHRGKKWPTQKTKSKAETGAGKNNSTQPDNRQQPNKNNNNNKKNGPKVVPSDDEDDEEDDSIRICDLEDITNGQWITVASPISDKDVGQDQSWTGYGYGGCKSHIWNERYLLTPSSPASSSSSTSSSVLGPSNRQSTIRQQNFEYAVRSKRMQWKIEQGEKQQQKTVCRQPEMDVSDFVEVLKRSPLFMIGDKFMELEYLSMECMILGMQEELKRGRQLSGDEGEDDSERIQIESVMPPVTELRLGPGKMVLNDASQDGSASAGTAAAPRIYRKAKPGKMQLVDRVSNLTLATFIRSDVLWDLDTRPANQNSTEALHPDCRLLGNSLQCEPTYASQAEQMQGQRKGRGNENTSQGPSNHGSWWNWWISDSDASSPQLSQSRDRDGNDAHQDESLESLSVGSDLDQDMINLEWASMLQQSVEEESNQKKTISRRPTVVISNGLFWRYDPQDVSVDSILDILASRQGGLDNGIAPKMSRVNQRNRKLTKTQQEQVKAYHNKRRTQLKQRYATVLANALHYFQERWPDLRVIVQTSVKKKNKSCESVSGIEGLSAQEQEQEEQEAALLNLLTKTIVARLQDPHYSFMDTTFLRQYKDVNPNKMQCQSFMLPGPLDILVQHIYGELFRLDL